MKKCHNNIEKCSKKLNFSKNAKTYKIKITLKQTVLPKTHFPRAELRIKTPERKLHSINIPALLIIN